MLQFISLIKIHINFSDTVHALKAYANVLRNGCCLPVVLSGWLHAGRGGLTPMWDWLSGELYPGEIDPRGLLPPGRLTRTGIRPWGVLFWLILLSRSSCSEETVKRKLTPWGMGSLISPLQSHISRLLSPVSCFTSPASYVLSQVSFPLFHVICLTSSVSRFLSHFSCLSFLSHVSCLA